MSGSQVLCIQLNRESAELDKLGLSDRDKKFHQECGCQIWMSGKTAKKTFPQRSIGMTDWKAAERYVKSLKDDEKDTAVHGRTISECITKFVDGHRSNVSERVLLQHQLVLGRMKDYMLTRNLSFMLELTTDNLEDFKTYGMPDWKKNTSKAIAVSKLKVFLREAYRRGWTTIALAQTVKSATGIYDQVQPFTHGETEKILTEAKILNGGTTGYATNGHTFSLLLETMLHNGLRVSDAIRYDPSRCVKSKKLWKYTFQPVKQRKDKAPKIAKVYFTEELKLAIDASEWFSKTLPFTYRTPQKGESKIEAAVYERMQHIGARCEIKDCRPHRLRHTFAYRMLVEKKIPLSDLSRLLYHGSIAITEKFYSAWSVERDELLESIMFESFENSNSH